MTTLPITELGLIKLSHQTRLNGFLLLCRLLVISAIALPFAHADDIEVFIPSSCGIEDKYRFVFIVDNSGSMSDLEFDQSKQTIDAASEYVLNNLANVELAIVQYGSNEVGDHAYDVTVPFTNTKTVAQNWGRVFGAVAPWDTYYQDHQPGSLSKMRRDGVYNAGGALDITDGDNVQFVFFTDAERDLGDACCSSIVAGPSTFAPTSTVHPMFGEYNALKNGSVLPGGIKAQFTVLHRMDYDETANQAGAAIASLGGNYTGLVENDPDDPDGAGTTPRRYLRGTLTATDTSEILALLGDVLKEIQFPSEIESFSSVAVDINRASWSTDNRAYFPLFKPSVNRAWQGNLKGYFIGSNGLEDTNGLPATEESDIGTVFAEQAQSFWSAQPDGNDALAGGATENFPNNRTLLSNVSAEMNLTHTENLLIDANTNVTNAMLAASDNAQRTSILSSLQTALMGDPLHSKPVVTKYNGKSIVYVMTNQGFLHAIDTTSPTLVGNHTGGEEHWAFMPQELLTNLPLLTAESTSGEHIYGLDGAITRWHIDHNQDGIVNDNDTLTLILGMRRGGRSYYAIDVTNPDSPKLKWQITGGTTPGFEDLAQSWSRMSLIRVKRNGRPATPTTKVDTDQVLVFGGGYDAGVLDDRTSRTTAGGGAIYMVDRDGALIWKTENAMQYSIPSDLTVIDSDADGLADRIYAPDLGGQIWRIDFDNVGSSSEFSVGKLAALGENSFQPFFYPPSVSAVGGYTRYFAISIGSGNRDHPLDESSANNLYMIKDEHTGKGPLPGSHDTIEVSDLYDVTDYRLGSNDPDVQAQSKSDLVDADGWVIKLAPGEKVLAEMVTIEGVAMATTFTPTQENSGAGSCGGIATSDSRFYMFDSATGSPVKSEATQDPNGSLSASDRSTVIGHSGIPSAPSILFPKNSGSVQILVDKQILSEIDQTLKVVFWHAR